MHRNLDELGTVELWQVSLGDTANDHPELLSTEELLRFGKIKHAQARQSFLRSRVATRRILAQYQDRQPDQVDFHYDQNGKPSLTNNQQGVEFNLSHSGDQCLIAVTQGKPVGVDIERVTSGRSYQALAKRFYTPAENQLLVDSSDETLFYRMWTLKEAHVKARGLKLMQGLDRFECSLTSDGELDVHDKQEGQGVWAQLQWSHAAAYEAALVVSGIDEMLLRHRRLEN